MDQLSEKLQEKNQKKENNTKENKNETKNESGIAQKEKATKKNFKQEKAQLPPKVSYI